MVSYSFHCVSSCLVCVVQCVAKSIKVAMLLQKQLFRVFQCQRVSEVSVLRWCIHKRVQVFLDPKGFAYRLYCSGDCYVHHFL